MNLSPVLWIVLIFLILALVLRCRKQEKAFQFTVEHFSGLAGILYRDPEAQHSRHMITTIGHREHIFVAARCILGEGPDRMDEMVRVGSAVQLRAIPISKAPSMLTAIWCHLRSKKPQARIWAVKSWDVV